MDTLRRTRAVVLWSVLLAATWFFGAHGLDAADKAPVPSVAAQNEALALVKDVYGGEYAEAESSEQKTALAQKLLQKAKETDRGTANHYALLRVAWDISTQAGDARVAMQITDAIAGAYEVNALSSKVATVRATAESVRSSVQRTALATVAMNLLDDAVAGDDYGSATELTKAALSAARKAQDWQLVKQIVARDKAVKEMADAYAKAQEALAALESDPTNPEANQVAGEFFCFFKRNWRKGIPMLALGSDVALRTLAQKDLKGTSSPNEQVGLGDDWWKLAQTHEGDRRDMLLLRAGGWYSAAEAGLSSGLTLDKVEKRLEEIGKTRATISMTIPDSTGEPPPARARFDERDAKRYQSLWAKHLNLPVVQTNSIGMRFVLIPPGEFDMGSTEAEVAAMLAEAKRRKAPSYYIKALPAEAPKHRVRITKPFYLGLCEVTQAEYARVMGNNPSKFQGDLSCPVERVNWNGAMEFCRRLGDMPEEKAAHAEYRLPTEAQWEYACRAGTTTVYNFGDSAAMLSRHAWWKGNSNGRTQSVGRLRPNPWGLFDMHGNVYEWCADWYAIDYYTKTPSVDPAGPESSSRRSCRGGSWNYGPDPFRCAYRCHTTPKTQHDFLGFRVVKTVSP